MDIYVERERERERRTVGLLGSDIIAVDDDTRKKRSFWFICLMAY